MFWLYLFKCWFVNVGFLAAATLAYRSIEAGGYLLRLPEIIAIAGLVLAVGQAALLTWEDEHARNSLPAE